MTTLTPPTTTQPLRLALLYILGKLAGITDIKPINLVLTALSLCILLAGVSYELGVLLAVFTLLYHAYMHTPRYMSRKTRQEQAIGYLIETLDLLDTPKQREIYLAMCKYEIERRRERE